MAVGDVTNDPPSSGSRRSMRALARQRSSESPPDDATTTRRRTNQRTTTYSPLHHVRRRQSALIDAQTCRGCGEAFDTILQLERHIPVCSEKDRLKELHATEDGGVDDSEGDNDFDQTKQMCIYCERQFTYLRTLRKHVVENCTVRRELIEQGEYTDLEWEQDMADKVQNSCSLPVSRDLTQSFNEMDDVEGGSVDGRRGKFRRRRGNNWGCRQKTRRSFKSSDAPDSLFGWEDAFLTMRGKDDADRILVNDLGLVKQDSDSGLVKHDSDDVVRSIRDTEPEIVKLDTDNLNDDLNCADGVLQSILHPVKCRDHHFDNFLETEANIVKHEASSPLVSSELQAPIFNNDETADQTTRESVGIEIKKDHLGSFCDNESNSGINECGPVTVSSSQSQDSKFPDLNPDESDVGMETKFDVSTSEMQADTNKDVPISKVLADNDKVTVYDSLCSGDHNDRDDDTSREDSESSAEGCHASKQSDPCAAIVGDCDVGLEKLKKYNLKSDCADGGNLVETPTKSRRRKGPRLTMRSKRRKTDLPKSDVQSDKTNKSDVDMV